jgi:hypothetical protein
MEKMRKRDVPDIGPPKFHGPWRDIGFVSLGVCYSYVSDPPLAQAKMGETDELAQLPVGASRSCGTRWTSPESDVRDKLGNGFGAMEYGM